MKIPGIIAIVDVETTEPNANTTEPKMIEAACVLYSVPHQCIISSRSFVVAPSMEPSPDGFYSTTISRIPQAVFEWLGYVSPEFEPTKFYSRLLGDDAGTAPLMGGAKINGMVDFFLAHGASFEQKFLTEPSIDWLCTLKDFELFPPDYQGQRTLKDLAQYYGVGISVTHRAIYDCLLLAEVLSRVPDLDRQFQIAQLPFCELMAPRFLPDGSKNRIETQGFTWNHDRQGWFAKDRRILGESFSQENILIDSPDQLCKAVVSYDQKDMAKQWGFSWDGSEKMWTKLTRCGGESFYPFPVEPINKG
jgi:DNA polymerase-3 subunit epsilon